MSEELVECQICGKKMKWIQNKHLSQHGITTKEYKKMFPNHPNKTSDMKKKIDETRWGDYTAYRETCKREGCDNVVHHKRQYCSNSCRSQVLAFGDHNHFMKPETNPAFKNGSSGSWQKKRKERVKLDNYTCTRCGKENLNGKDVKYGVHHIVPKKCFTIDNLDERDDVTNSTTLCNPCHKEVEAQSLWWAIEMLIEKGVSREEITEAFRSKITANAPFEAFITKSTDE